MSLPVLNVNPVGPVELVRSYHRAMLDWGRGVATVESAGEYGTLLANAGLADTDANGVADAFLSDRPAADVVAEVDAWFAGCGATCRGWTMNPSMAVARTGPLVDHLGQAGWVPRRRAVLRLDRLRPVPFGQATGAALLPARSAYPAVARLSADRWANDRWANDRPAAAAVELHLDDPRVDGTVAVAAGRALGYAALLNAGEIGTVVDLYVDPASRRRGVGTTLLRAMLETAARAGHRHVLVGVPDGADELARLFAATGFVSVGEWVRYERPPSPTAERESPESGGWR